MKQENRSLQAETITEGEANDTCDKVSQTLWMNPRACDAPGCRIKPREQLWKRSSPLKNEKLAQQEPHFEEDRPFGEPDLGRFRENMTEALYRQQWARVDFSNSLLNAVSHGVSGLDRVQWNRN